MLVKRNENNEPWVIADNIRKWNVDGTFMRLVPNDANAEANTPSWFGMTSTGFKTFGNIGANKNYVYMAIRRSHKPPTAATEVFKPLRWTGAGGIQAVPTGFPVDLNFTSGFTSSGFESFTRLNGFDLYQNTTSNNALAAARVQGDSNVAQIFGTSAGEWWNQLNQDVRSYFFKRAAKFFDVVTYQGNGANRTISHNLESTPSVVIVKAGSTTGNWYWQHYALGANTWLQLNNEEAKASNGTLFNSTLPTSTNFSLGSAAGVNGSGIDYTAFLWADLDGICKAGTYTGTGYALQVDCGFTSSSRLVIIKRVDGTAGSNVGSWYSFDAAGGITGSGDRYTTFDGGHNDTASWIDAYNPGFQLTSASGGQSEINANGGTYAFLAIA